MLPPNNIKQIERLFGTEELCVTILLRKAARSVAQNRFYWMVVIPPILQGLKDTHGDKSLTPDDAHYMCKLYCNSKEITDQNTGEVNRIPQSTTKLTKEEFSHYMEKCIKFFSEALGITINLNTL